MKVLIVFIMVALALTACVEAKDPEIFELGNISVPKGPFIKSFQMLDVEDSLYVVEKVSDTLISYLNDEKLKGIALKFMANMRNDMTEQNILDEDWVTEQMRMLEEAEDPKVFNTTYLGNLAYLALHAPTEDQRLFFEVWFWTTVGLQADLPTKAFGF